LRMIRNGALFVNTSRGSLVDEQALTIELRRSRFTAVLDVYENEPLSAKSELRTFDKAILMPHRAASPAREQMTFAMIDEIRRFIAGEVLQHEISKEKYHLMTR